MNDMIKEILDDLFDEVEGSRHYAKWAIKVRDEDKELADAFSEMSKQEAIHAERLMTQGCRIVKRPDIDDGTKAVWNYAREKAAEMLGDARSLQAQYK